MGRAFIYLFMEKSQHGAVLKTQAVQAVAMPHSGCVLGKTEVKRAT